MDILDGLAQIRITFKRVGIEPPTVILLGSHEEGMRFLSAIRQTNSWAAVVGSGELGKSVLMCDGSTWMELTVMGLMVRWPANRVALPDGTWAHT